MTTPTRFVGYAFAGAVVVGLGAFSLRELPPEVRVPPIDAAIPERASEVAAPTPATPAAPDVALDRSVSDAAARDDTDVPARNGDREGIDDGDDRARIDDDDDDDRRRRWRRSRRRYREPLPDPADWEAPEGPVRIGLQAGHWRTNEAPRELNGLRNGGTRGGGKYEWEVNLALAERTGALLEDAGYVVDILPAVVPPDYRAHLFIAIHADGSNDPAARGFRIAAPRWDATGRAGTIVELLEESYARETGLRRLPDTTRRMRNYYAFNSRRYEHSLHPMTIGLILETGFLTSAADRAVIVDDPDRVARAILESVRAFEVTASPAGYRTEAVAGGS